MISTNFNFLEFMQFANNPTQYMANRGFNVPNNINNSNQLIQHMMNNGMLSQSQYNQALNQANQLQKTPQFMQFLNKFNLPR